MRVRLKPFPAGSFAPCYTGLVCFLGVVLFLPVSVGGSNIVRGPAGPAAGCLSGTYPNPGLAGVTTLGGVLFSDGTCIVQDAVNLFWDNTAKHLGIGTNVPLFGLDVSKANTFPPFAIRKGITGTGIISSAIGGLGNSTAIVQTDSDVNFGMIFAGYGTFGQGPANVFISSRSTDGNTNVILQNGNLLGDLLFFGDNGAGITLGAEITVSVDGTPGAADMPGRIQMFTTPDGATVPLKRIDIRNTGNIEIGASGDLGLIRALANRLQINTGVVGTRGSLDAANISASQGVQTDAQTVASLPACVAGLLGTRRAVNNALAPAIGAAVVGGGAAGAAVWCNGAAWTVTGV